MKKKKFLALAVATAIAGTTMLGATSATSDYMHYQDGTISICDPSSNGTRCITMQDRNYGATEAGVYCINYSYYCAPMWEDDGYESVEACIADDNSTVYCNLSRESFGNTFSSQSDCENRGESLFESCLANHSEEIGKHYQRGNNYGFAPCTDSNWCNSFPNLESTGGGLDCGGYTPTTPLENSVFRVGYSDYCSLRNDNLRGGANDSQSNNRGFNITGNTVINPEDRKGPCDEGYHVPSIGEWNQVLKYWAEENGIELEDHKGLKYNYTTLDGLKFQEDFKIPFAGYRDFMAIVGGIGNYANFWSSSPNVGGYYARYFNINLHGANADISNDRASAYSLRCFKDSYLEFPSSEGGDSEIIVNIAEFNGGQNTCSGSNYIFENIVAGTSTGTHTLSGVFQCAFGNGRSSSTVTLQLSGDLVADGDRVISGSNLMMKNSEWTVSPVGLKFADTLISTWKALTATQTLFTKTANLIGVASGVVEVQLTVPGGTPDGTYNGVLVLTY